MTQMLQLGRTGLLTIAWLMVMPCVVLLFSAIVPIVPWVRIYACSVVPNHTSWLFLWSIAALIIGLLVNYRRHSAFTRGLVAMATIAVLATASVMLHLLYIAESNGARIDVIRALSLRAVSDGAAPDESRVYARPPGEPLWLDIYHPRRASPGALSPVMVAVHGGGFFEGSRSTGAANMRWYADHGWTVISIDYRLARPDRPTWNLATTDVRCALAWTAAHAAALGIDINRLALTGGSAGGTLAMAAAYAPDTASPDPTCGPMVPHVAALVVKAPLIDVADSWRHPGELRDLQRQYLARYFGGSPEQYPARYAAAEVRRFLRPGMPPTLILGGADDPLVPPEGATAFARASTAAGNQVRQILFPYSGHDFNTTFDSITNQALLQIIAQFMSEQERRPIMPHQARAIPFVATAYTIAPHG